VPLIQMSMKIGERRPSLTVVCFKYGASGRRARWPDCGDLPFFDNKIDLFKALFVGSCRSVA